MSPVILYGIEMWCLKENDIRILKLNRATLMGMFVLKVIDRKGIIYIMQMLGYEVMTQLAKENNANWYAHVLRRKGGHVMKKTLDIEVRGHSRKWRPKRTWMF